MFMTLLSFAIASTTRTKVFGHRKASLGRLREIRVAHIQCVHICPRAKWNTARGYPPKGKANSNQTRSPFGPFVTSSSRCHLRTIAAAGVR